MKEQVCGREGAFGMPLRQWKNGHMKWEIGFQIVTLGQTTRLSTLMDQVPGQKICHPTDIEWWYWYRDMSCFKFQLKMLIIRTDSLRGAVGFHPKVKLPPPLRVSGVHDTWSEVGPRQIASHKVWKLRKRPSLLQLLFWLWIIWLQWLPHHVCVFVLVFVLVCEKCSQMFSGAEELLISRLMEGKSTNWDRAKRCAEQLRSPDYTTQHFHETRPKRTQPPRKLEECVT